MNFKLTLLFFVVLTAFTSPAQDLSWVHSFGGPGSESSTAQYVDAQGNIYLTGIFQYNSSFSTDSTQLDSLHNKGRLDGFVAKYDSTGALLWAHGIGGTQSEIAYNIAGNGNYIYVVGDFGGTVDFDPGSATENRTSVGSHDAFLLKLTTAGNFVSVKQFSGPYFESLTGITFDKDNNILVSGRFQGAIDLDPGPGVDSLKFSNYEGAFVTKLDAAGNYIWGKGIDCQEFWEVETDTAGNVYLAGEFKDTTDFDPGNGTYSVIGINPHWNLFILKLDENGDFQWANTYDARNSSFAVDDAQNVYLGGFFENTVDFDAGSGTTNKTSKGVRDIFSLKLDKDGSLMRVQTMGSTHHEEISVTRADSVGFVYQLGTFDKPLDFDPGPDTLIISPGALSRGSFIRKLDTAGQLDWVTVFKPLYPSDVAYITSAFLDPEGSIYAAGYFTGAINFSPDTAATNLYSNGYADGFFLKLSFTPFNLGGSERADGREISLYPNPSKGLFQINGKHSFSEAKVISTSGHILAKRVLEAGQQTLDFSGLGAGNYFLILESGTGQTTVKISIIP